MQNKNKNKNKNKKIKYNNLIRNGFKLKSIIVNSANCTKKIGFMIGGYIGRGFRNLFTKNTNKHTRNNITNIIQKGGMQELDTFSTKKFMVSEKKSIDILKQNNKVTLSLAIGAIICVFAFILPALFPFFIVVLFCLICYLFARDNYKKYVN